MGYFSEIIADSRTRIGRTRERAEVAPQPKPWNEAVADTPPAEPVTAVKAGVAGAPSFADHRPGIEMDSAVQLHSADHPAEPVPAAGVVPVAASAADRTPSSGQSSAADSVPPISAPFVVEEAAPVARREAAESVVTVSLTVPHRPAQPTLESDSPSSFAGDQVVTGNSAPDLPRSAPSQAPVAAERALTPSAAESMPTGSAGAAYPQENQAQSHAADPPAPRDSVIAQEVRVRTVDVPSASVERPPAQRPEVVQREPASSTHGAHLQIGVVNVIVEGAASPAKRAPATGDRNIASRNFLRSL